MALGDGSAERAQMCLGLPEATAILAGEQDDRQLVRRPGAEQSPGQSLDLIDPLTQRRTGGIDQPRYTPSIEYEVEAAIRRIVQQRARRYCRLGIGAERQERGDRVGEGAIVEHDICGGQRAPFKRRRLGSRRQLDEPQLSGLDIG